MKLMVFLLVCFSTLTTTQGQVRFTSSYTQTWPGLFTTEVDEVNRSIWIDANEIIIITETLAGKDIEKLNIERYEEGESSYTFSCTSGKSREPVVVVIPYKDQIRTIDLYRTSSRTGEEIQVRLHLNRQVN